MKCDGHRGHDCSWCARRGTVCTFSPKQKPGPKGGAGSNQHIPQRFAPPAIPSPLEPCNPARVSILPVTSSDDSSGASGAKVGSGGGSGGGAAAAVVGAPAAGGGVGGGGGPAAGESEKTPRKAGSLPRPKNSQGVPKKSQGSPMKSSSLSVAGGMNAEVRGEFFCVGCCLLSLCGRCCCLVAQLERDRPSSTFGAQIPCRLCLV